MQTILVSIIPTGDFQEINMNQPGWQARFLSLVKQGKEIQYRLSSMPNTPNELDKALSQTGYLDYIPLSDPSKHFLKPVLRG